MLSGRSGVKVWYTVGTKANCFFEQCIVLFSSDMLTAFYNEIGRGCK